MIAHLLLLGSYIPFKEKVQSEQNTAWQSLLVANFFSTSKA